MEVKDIIKLIQAVAENDLTGFKYKQGDASLVIKKEKEVYQVVSETTKKIGTESAIQDFLPEINGVMQKDCVELSSDKVISSPLVGTFYHGSSPEEPPFVRVGDEVKKGQVLGIIEAMKLMNEIESEYDGVIEAVLVENEGVVEYGQPLFRIR